MFIFYIENHEPFESLVKNCLQLDKDKSIVSRFQYLWSTYLQLVVFKRKTMWNVSIFLSEGLYYSYICLLIFQGDRQNCISRTGERISPTILLFFRKGLLEYQRISLPIDIRIEHFLVKLNRNVFCG